MCVDSFAPIIDSLGEPHFEFMGGTLGRIASVANVATEVDAEISADATRLASKWLSLAKHLPSLLDDVLSFPAHAHDGARGEELAQTSIETLGAEVSIVSLGHFKCRPYLREIRDVVV